MKPTGTINPADDILSKQNFARIQRNWNSLLYLNVYRLSVSFGLLLASLLNLRWQPFGQQDPRLFLLSSVIYVVLSLLSMATIGWRRPRFTIQLNVQIIGDIVLIVMMMAASGGVRSGLGLLLIVSLASSALVTGGRMVMFYAALAATSVLVSQMLWIWHSGEVMADIGQAGLLGLAFFATAVVAWVLADRNRMSEALAAARAKDLRNMSEINQLVIDDMQDGVIVLDGDARIRQANRRALDWLGGHVTDEAGVPLLLQRQLPLLAQYLEQWRGNPHLRFSSVALGDSGDHYLPRFIAVSNRRAMGAVLVLEDLSRIREEAQQIKLAAMGRLTANIAHEIRNPLAAISHACELLIESEEAGQHRLLQIALNNTQRINALVNDVMALNRLDRVQPARIQLDQFVREWLDEFRHSVHMADEQFDLILAEGSEICFDRNHLRQVLTNLGLNAVRYCRQLPGSVVIRVETVRQQTMIHVQDNGPGVSAAVLPHLFEPFFTTASTGTGLGLYISRELCQANGANLDYLPEPAGGHFRIVSQGNVCQDND